MLFFNKIIAKFNKQKLKKKKIRKKLALFKRIQFGFLYFNHKTPFIDTLTVALVVNYHLR